MRFIVALLLMTDVAMAQVQNRTYQDAIGRNTGRSVTDSRGNTTYYDAMGRNTGRSVDQRQHHHRLRPDGSSDRHDIKTKHAGHDGHAAGQRTSAGCESGATERSRRKSRTSIDQARAIGEL